MCNRITSFLHGIGFLSCIMLLNAGCGDDHIVYRESLEFGANGWQDDDLLRYVFTIDDTMSAYDLLLDVSHAEEYAWQNLYVQITTEFPGDSVKHDVLSLELSDRAGGWVGKCRSGACRITIPLQTRIRFPLAGEYALVFSQYMRFETVPGISALGLTVRSSRETQ